jgi:putative inorganic carbon (hco3(-)) transporter
MKIISYLNRIIEYSFYALFLLVPLIFTSATSELFELPKMWLTFGLTLLITFAWGARMVFSRQIKIQRTPLDIPILIFLAAHIISTIFSLDSHVSLWGYYSRFNGGLLSIISYLLLYYAFVSNFTIKQVLNVLKISLASGLIVALWGVPSHFGYDPTCFIFRQSFDTSCWTDAFKPTIRIFSTLGQPAWLAAYLGLLIPISIAYFLVNKSWGDQLSTRYQEVSSKYNGGSKPFILNTLYLILPFLFYAALTYTDTRGGFIGFWIANISFWLVIYLKKFLTLDNFKKYFLIFNLSFLIFNFLQGVPISQLEKFTLPTIVKNAEPIPVHAPSPSPAAGALGGTDSGKIRLFVWSGAINAWIKNPITGTGVETFAYAYYKHKPLGHNLTSEWDYLYNKAHNEYLNYLTTTGILGMGSYLAIIGTFLIISIKKFKDQSSKLKVTVENLKSEKLLALDSNFALCTLHFALIAGYISILISNFFGFSVVIVNLYFFLVPAFVFILNGSLSPKKSLSFPKAKPASLKKITGKQWYLLSVLLIAFGLLLIALTNRFRADVAYATGSTLNKSGAYQEAYPFLVKAVSLVGGEPVYKDELSINMGTLAAALYLQNETEDAEQLKDQAIAINDNVVNTHPNNIVFWKSRVRLFYALAQGDPDNEKEYLDEALEAVRKSQALAPTDAKISYNLGILLGQRGDLEDAVEELEKTIKLKPNYKDAYFALALFFDELGNREKAVESLTHILTEIDPNDEQAKETLEEWR